MFMLMIILRNFIFNLKDSAFTSEGCKQDSYMPDLMIE